ncbi:HMG box protein [Aspergillus uvarum CBS 121591]|uniref:HMG box protein n=1 Tax=Aspergillus uvarum CBS 121591 TaxID=1448315 RepID=A0A319BZQ8_9EURO|nr:HMG box protein [Aspergillus uvarum CBS 121591]PYH78265.1 HMG box protein [Aspergillus uvarum CBS 121591]
MSPKEDSKASDATITVNVDDFTRTRDNVIASLAQLAKAVTTVQEAYINHANTVLGRDPVPLLDLSHLTSGITGALYGSGARGTSPGANADTDGKKKRKRAPPDPNAPKRALTPFFLYMQHNRSVIAKDLGPNAKPKEVSDEGTRRWAEMEESEKEIWKKLYADNLAEYRKKVVAYKAGLPYEDDLKAENQLHQGMETGEPSDESEEEEEEEEGEEEEEEESSPEPVREPTPPRSGKRRRSEGKPSLTKETATPSAKKESPEKKKRTSARKEKETQDEQPPASARKTASAEAKRTKKKRKSEVGNEE